MTTPLPEETPVATTSDSFIDRAFKELMKNAPITGEKPVDTTLSVESQESKLERLEKKIIAIMDGFELKEPAGPGLLKALNPYRTPSHRTQKLNLIQNLVEGIKQHQVMDPNFLRDCYNKSKKFVLSTELTTDGKESELDLVNKYLTEQQISNFGIKKVVLETPAVVGNTTDLLEPEPEDTLSLHSNEGDSDEGDEGDEEEDTLDSAAPTEPPKDTKDTAEPAKAAEPVSASVVAPDLAPAVAKKQDNVVVPPAPIASSAAPVSVASTVTSAVTTTTTTTVTSTPKTTEPTTQSIAKDDELKRRASCGTPSAMRNGSPPATTTTVVPPTAKAVPPVEPQNDENKPRSLADYIKDKTEDAEGKKIELHGSSIFSFGLRSDQFKKKEIAETLNKQLADPKLSAVESVAAIRKAMRANSKATGPRFAAWPGELATILKRMETEQLEKMSDREKALADLANYQELAKETKQTDNGKWLGLRSDQAAKLAAAGAVLYVFDPKNAKTEKEKEAILNKAIDDNRSATVDLSPFSHGKLNDILLALQTAMEQPVVEMATTKKQSTPTLTV